MLIEIQHTEFAAATPENVWQKWSDVTTWPTWDHGVEWCKMKEGHRFELHGEALLLPKGAPAPLTIRIIECQVNQSFTDEGTLPWGMLRFYHFMTLEPGGVKLTHKLHFHPSTSEAKALFESIMLAKLQKELPTSVKSLAKLVGRKCHSHCGCKS